MKRLFICSVILLVLSLVLLSCRKTGNISYAPSSEEENNTDILFDVETVGSFDSNLSSDVSNEWENYPEYTGGIPAPNFFKSKALPLTVGDVSMVVFTSSGNEKLIQLKDYLSSLENAGFTYSIITDEEEFFEGAVYKEENLVFEYTFRYGTIIFEVFLNNFSEDIISSVSQDTNDSYISAK